MDERTTLTDDEMTTAVLERPYASLADADMDDSDDAGGDADESDADADADDSDADADDSDS